MRFGIEDDFAEIQSIGRSEEEVKIFECLGQDEALHFIALPLGHDISKRAVSRLRALACLHVGVPVPQFAARVVRKVFVNTRDARVPHIATFFVPEQSYHRTIAEVVGSIVTASLRTICKVGYFGAWYRSK